MSNADEPVRHLGRQYVLDPSLVAKELLCRLANHDEGGLLIEQAWLNCHWDNPDAIDFLVEISDIYGMAPEPLREFMHVCWARDEPAWHHFLTLDLLEDDPELAQHVFQRLAEEGPSDAVIDSLMFLQGSLDSDAYAEHIMPDLINAGMVDNVCVGLLRLWRRYGVCDGLHQDALQELRRALGQPLLANAAVRVVECLRFRDVRPMLPNVAFLACHGWDIATRRARRVLVEVSGGMYAKHVARAVCQQPWRSWMARLHPSCLWRLLDFMRDFRAMEPMTMLLNQFPVTALRHGVFTRIMEMSPDYFEREIIDHVDAAPFPTSVHAAVHYMYMRGQPPPAISLFYKALEQHPDAVCCIAMRAPNVHREMTWARRKLLLCAMVAACRGRGKRTRPGCCTGKKLPRKGVLHALASHECVWHAVLQYL